MPNETKPAVVLVADDEPSMLSLIAQHVKTLGHTVHLAHDGAEAWSQAQAHKPDLVLLDVMMPVMSGWEVCRMVREEPSLQHTAVIMITGIGERLNELTSPLFGADRYLDKPFELSDLDKAIAEVLSKRKTNGQHVGSNGLDEEGPGEGGSSATEDEISAPMPDLYPLASAEEGGRKKGAPKKGAAKKGAAKKGAAKKGAAKKAVAKKSVAKKGAPKKAAAKKGAAKKAPKRAPAKRAAKPKAAKKKAAPNKKRSGAKKKGRR